MTGLTGGPTVFPVFNASTWSTTILLKEGRVMSTARFSHPKSESPAGPVNWLQLDRSPHAIQFYSGDDFLLDSLSRFVSSALQAGDSCFVLATQAHLNGLAERLKALGIDTDKAVRRRRYVTADAFQVLAQIMVDGKLDKTRFDDFIGEVVLPLKTAAESRLRRVPSAARSWPCYGRTEKRKPRLSSNA